MRIGLVCRFKPVHLGHAALLEEVCERGDEVLIGVGSSNRYDLRNPFTFEETVSMVEAVLRPRFQNYAFLAIPDLGHGPRWRAMVCERMGDLDLFVSANEYVRGLLGQVYPLAHPLQLIDPERRVPIDGTRVRRAMARGEAWEELVPRPVAQVLRAKGLVGRFRREFGLTTLLEDVKAKLPLALLGPEHHWSKEVGHVLLG